MGGFLPGEGAGHGCTLGGGCCRSLLGPVTSAWSLPGGLLPSLDLET